MKPQEVAHDREEQHCHASSNYQKEQVEVRVSCRLESLRSVERSEEAEGNRRFEQQRKQQHEESVAQQKNEILAVEESDTGIQPRTVMVHIEYAAAAGGTVMTAFRFVLMADQTISTFSFFDVFEIKALISLAKAYPVVRRSSGVGQHRGEV